MSLTDVVELPNMLPMKQFSKEQMMSLEEDFRAFMVKMEVGLATLSERLSSLGEKTANLQLELASMRAKQDAEMNERVQGCAACRAEIIENYIKPLERQVWKWSGSIIAVAAILQLLPWVLKLFQKG